MTETELNTGILQFQTTVCIVDDLSEQVTLGIGLRTAIKGTAAIVDVPPGILFYPVTVQVLVTEDVVECNTLAQLRILHITGQHKQVIIQLLGIDMLFHVCHVVEEGTHQAVELIVTLNKLVILLLRHGIHPYPHQLSVLLVKEDHVAMGSIIMIVEVGPHTRQLQQELFHRS